MLEQPKWVDDELLRIGALDFHCDLYGRRAPAGRIPVMKPRVLVDHWLELSRSSPASRIVELGIRWGGSTVLLHQLFRPEKLIAIELESDPAPALADYIEQQGLAAVVRPHYGVDQADRAALAGILEGELGNEMIDLVIDDASHLYGPTRSSFESLFPRLRPGGLFLIEDWHTPQLLAHELAKAQAGERSDISIDADRLRRACDDPAARPAPLLQLAVELLIARASRGDVIRELVVKRGWLVVERGAEPLTHGSFDLSDHVHDFFGFTRMAEPGGQRP